MRKLIFKSDTLQKLKKEKLNVQLNVYEKNRMPVKTVKPFQLGYVVEKEIRGTKQSNSKDLANSALYFSINPNHSSQ